MTTLTYALTATTSILRSDGVLIPADTKNYDYQTYLAWVQQGNTATAYTAPAAPPLTCLPYEFKAALVQQNLYSQALAAVNAAPLLTQLAWSEALTFCETDPLIVSMATALGQTTDQVHALFQLAQTLTP